MTATLTERSEGTAAHKGFNPMRELENGRINPQVRSPSEYAGLSGAMTLGAERAKTRTFRRRTAAVHQGRAGEPGDPPAPRGDSGPHRAALRREHVRRVLRGPRHAAAGL